MSGQDKQDVKDLATVIANYKNMDKQFTEIKKNVKDMATTVTAGFARLDEYFIYDKEHKDHITSKVKDNGGKLDNHEDRINKIETTSVVNSRWFRFLGIPTMLAAAGKYLYQLIM